MQINWPDPLGYVSLHNWEILICFTHSFLHFKSSQLRWVDVALGADSPWESARGSTLAAFREQDAVAQVEITRVCVWHTHLPPVGLWRVVDMVFVWADGYTSIPESAPPDWGQHQSACASPRRTPTRSGTRGCPRL